MREYVEALSEDVMDQMEALPEGDERRVNLAFIVGLLDGVTNMINVTYGLERTEYVDEGESLV